MKVEKLLTKAIAEFKKKNPKSEFRGCYLAEGSGRFGNWSEATFHFEYVNEVGGDYNDIYITVSAEEDDAVKLYEMNEKLKEENEALKKEKSFAWDRAENEYNENIKAAKLMIRYDELLQKLNGLNEKTKRWLKS